jgi:ParB family chromosome partitioning protein
VDVHPFEEAQGFQRLLDIPGYDVAALVEKSGKSASHIYARLSLLQLIPEVAEAFLKERITASHANLIARIPQESQAIAFEQCWRKDWQDKEPHLLPAKYLSAWIQTNLYLALADAPFDREDPTLNPTAGACVNCPRRSGHNTSLFCDVQGDQCKLCGIWATASRSCWLAAAAPTAWAAAIQPSVLLEPPTGGSFG